VRLSGLAAIACLLFNNYLLSIIEPLQFADFLIILTPKLAKYTNKTFGKALCGRRASYSYHLRIALVAVRPTARGASIHAISAFFIFHSSV